MSNEHEYPEHDFTFTSRTRPGYVSRHAAPAPESPAAPGTPVFTIELLSPEGVVLHEISSAELAAEAGPAKTLTDLANLLTEPEQQLLITRGLDASPQDASGLNAPGTREWLEG